MAYKRIPQFLSKEINGRLVTGITAVHGNIDDGGDKSLNGSFTDWINSSQRKRASFLWQHDALTPPTASIKAVREVERGELPAKVLAYAPDATGGVEVTREYYPKDVSDLSAWILHGIKVGDIREMSYAYDINEGGAERVRENGRSIRLLKSLSIYDFSDVVWGLNPATAGAKHGRYYQQSQPRKGKQLAIFLKNSVAETVSGTQTEAAIIELMADAAGIEADTVRQILNGDIIRPPEARLAAFAELLNVPLSELQELADEDAAKCWLPDNLRLAESADLARIATAVFKKRVHAIETLRNAHGRQLSDGSKRLVKALIQSLHEEVEALQTMLAEPIDVTNSLQLRARAAELALYL